jgi:hypothetical protein
MKRIQREAWEIMALFIVAFAVVGLLGIVAHLYALVFVWGWGMIG